MGFGVAAYVVVGGRGGSGHVVFTKMVKWVYMRLLLSLGHLSAALLSLSFTFISLILSLRPIEFGLFNAVSLHFVLTQSV